MQKLLVVPEPRYDDNIFGYIQRLSIENGYDDHRWILSMLEIKKNTVYMTLI